MMKIGTTFPLNQSWEAATSSKSFGSTNWTSSSYASCFQCWAFTLNEFERFASFLERSIYRIQALLSSQFFLSQHEGITVNTTKPETGPLPSTTISFDYAPTHDRHSTHSQPSTYSTSLEDLNPFFSFPSLFSFLMVELPTHPPYFSVFGPLLVVTLLGLLFCHVE